MLTRPCDKINTNSTNNHKQTTSCQPIIETITMNEGGNNVRQSNESLSNELFNVCRLMHPFHRHESFSEEGLREIIDRHGLTPNNHVDDYEFFHAACRHWRVTEGIIRCLLEYFPAAASAIGEGGAPSFVGEDGNIITNLPLHWLLKNRRVNKTAAVNILKLLIEKYPEAARHADNDGRLPIHIAAGRSPDFCRVLIEAHPGSEQMADVSNGRRLPLHHACANNSLATVEYLYRQYPEAINKASSWGYPIHTAITGVIQRDSPASAVKIVQFLLDCDPNQKLIQYRGESLLHYACHRPIRAINRVFRANTDSTIIEAAYQAAYQIIEVLYNAHPEAIEHHRIASNVRQFHQQVQIFIHGELVYARQANDLRIMTTPDDNGRLPLHTALQNNVRLGSIKLLVKGNRQAVQSLDNIGALPLHIACQHHGSASVVQYLLNQDEAALAAVDSQGNTVLHYACRGAKHVAIALLLEKYDTASVSKRNSDDKLPIDLLWESNEVSDRESIEYTGSVFQLVRAYPEMIQSVI